MGQCSMQKVALQHVHGRSGRKWPCSRLKQRQLVVSPPLSVLSTYVAIYSFEVDLKCKATKDSFMKEFSMALQT